MALTVGSRVEVIANGPAFDNSFFAATLVEVEGRRAWVEFESLIDDRGERIVEKVRLRHIRTYPATVVIMLKPGDIVDVYQGGGWWRATIVGESDTHFHVHFESVVAGMEYGTFEKGATRIHQIWKRADPRNLWMFPKL